MRATTVQNIVTYNVVVGVENADLRAEAGHDRKCLDHRRAAGKRGESAERSAALSPAGTGRGGEGRAVRSRWAAEASRRSPERAYFTSCHRARTSRGRWR